MTLFELEKIVRLQPLEQRLLKLCCGVVAGIGTAWIVAVPIWILGKEGMPERALLACWLIAFAALAVGCFQLFRAASRPIVEIAEAFRRVLMVVFAIRLFESILYLVNSGVLFSVYVFLALLGLWTIWSMAGITPAIQVRLIFLAVVFTLVLGVFLASGVSFALSGVQRWDNVFWTVSPQVALILPHLVFIWGAHRYKHLFMVRVPEEDGLAQ